jgi:predicted transcriptional regulator
MLALTQPSKNPVFSKTETEIVNLGEIVKIVEGRILTKQTNLEIEISSCGASDLMSDALSFMKQGSLLLTGLVHAQTVRTAEMADLSAVMFVRGKNPGPEVTSLADELGIPLIASPYGMYETCGRLYKAGLLPTMKQV